MQDFAQILDNQVLWVALLACILAQLSKLAFELVQHGKINLRVLVTTGGMPSSHSAFVGALATGVGKTMGWGSPDFAIAVVFAVIVMYDAAGVRQAAGKQARILSDCGFSIRHYYCFRCGVKLAIAFHPSSTVEKGG